MSEMRYLVFFMIGCLKGLLAHHNLYYSRSPSTTQDCNCYPSDLTKLSVKSNLTYAEVSDEHFWEIPFLKELLSVRSNEIVIPGFERDELSQIINY